MTDAWQGWIAIVAAVAAVALPLAVGTSGPTFVVGLGIVGAIVAGTLLLTSAFTLRGPAPAAPGSPQGVAERSGMLLLGVFILALFAFSFLPEVEEVTTRKDLSMGAALGLTAGYWALVVVAWMLAWLLVTRLSAVRTSGRFDRIALGIAIPAVFGVTVICLWEIIVRGFAVPFVIMPPPSAVWGKLATSVPTLLADFRQTFLKAVLAGYAIGCGSGFLVALLVDRVPFLRRGLLPIGNLVSALPIIGIAPVMVMWFGFDWQSKSAVVVAMTFFPMLVNTLAGLAASDAMERDLMRTYAATHRQSLMKLRLPAALPFIFNALKINSTLAMIGAIVAEFFGTPIVGMGFRISTEVGRMNTDMVWAEIAVAAMAGSAFYGIVALIERAVTFWHPSFRQS